MAIERNSLVDPLVRWRPAILGGLIAGMAFLIYEMVMLPLFMGSPLWGPPRMMAAIALGEDVLPPPAVFDLGVVIVAMGVHFVLSIIYALIIGAIVEHTGFAAAVVIGVVAGLLLYGLNFYALTEFFPWFAMARNWVSVSGHVLFGLVAATAYRGIRPGRAEL